MLLQEKNGLSKLFYIVFFSPPDIASILSFCHFFLDVNYQVKIWTDDKTLFSLTNLSPKLLFLYEKNGNDLIVITA